MRGPSLLPIANRQSPITIPRAEKLAHRALVYQDAQGDGEMRDHVEAAALSFWRKVWRPFAVGAFWFRSWKRNQRRFPTIWRTDAQLVRIDLDYAADDEIEKFDKGIFKDLVEVRNRLKLQWSKLFLFGVTTFLIQLSFISGIKMNASLLGVKIADQTGLPELLLVASSTISLLGLQIQARYEAINSAIVWGVGILYPTSLKSILEIAYDDNTFGKYFSTNLPHYIHQSAHSRIGRIAVYFYSISLICVLAVVLYINYLIYINIWNTQKLGWWSVAACVYALLSLIGGTAFLFYTRFPMPYRDYSKLHYMQMVRQFQPHLEPQELMKEYAEDNADRDAMKARGYTIE